MKVDKLLLLILIITVLLRLPTFFEPYWYFDEGIYAVVGSRWMQGASLYTDIWDHKPPGLFLLYGLSFLIGKISTIDILAVIKILACIAIAITQIAIFKLGRQITKNTGFGICAAALYGVLVSFPLWEGYMANGEIFLVAFSTWGIYLIVRSLPTEALAKVGQKSKVKNPFSYLMGGLLLGLAVLIKPVAIAETSLCILWVITSLKPKRARIALGCLVAGLITPLAAAGLYFLSRGAFSDFIYATLEYNLKYSAANGLPLEQDLLLNILRICSLITVVYLGFRNKKSPKSLVLTWFFLDLLVISLSMRPYIHYLIQAFPPLTLLTVLLISKLKPFDLTKTFATITTQFSSYCLLTASYLLLILIPLNQELEITNNIPYQFNQFAYHANFIKFALGKIPESEYVQFFKHNTATNSKIASFVKEYSNRYPFQSTQVLIWGGGEAPWLYYELGQLGLTPATRFTNYFHIESTSGGYQEIVEILKETPPQIFVIFPDTPACPQLTEIVEHFYEKIEEVDGVYIYKKSESRITN